MVSAPSSSTQKQPLSYADSARKAQGIRSVISPVIQRGQSQNLSAPSPSSTGSLLQPSNTTVVASNAIVRVTSTTDNAPAISSTPSEVESTQKTPNGHSHSPSLDPAAGPSVSAVKASVPPVVNIWNVRRERMAQAQAQAQALGHPPQVQTAASTSQKAANPDRTIVSSSAAAGTSDPVHPPSRSSASTDDPQRDTNREHPLVSTIDPVVVPRPKTSKAEDVWAVRPGPTLAVPLALPHLDDATAWPEVGKGAIAASASSSRSRNEVERDGEDLRGDREEAESDHLAIRKGEKTKWMSVPTEAVLAMDDAQRPSRRGAHGKSRSQHQSEGRGHNAVQASASTSASASASVSVSTAPSVSGGVGSKGHSRAQSAVRDQASSQAPSVPQSQAQSRTGSVQSSPKHTVRGKRLPEENGGAADSSVPSASNRSVRSSRAASPQSQSRPYLQVATTITGIKATVPISVAPTIPLVGINPTQMRENSPMLPYPDGRGSPYYPLPPPPMGSYPSTRAGNSPVMTPYPVVAPGYPTSPVPMPPPYGGSPPYPPYPPYPYPYPGQAYPPYWAPQGASPDASAPYRPLPHSQPIVQFPLPAPDSRRPGAAITPATSSSGRSASFHHPSNSAPQQGDAEASSSSSPQSRKGSEKGRARVLSFGSILVAGSSTPASPAPGAAPSDSAKDVKLPVEAASLSQQNIESSGLSDLSIERSSSRVAISVSSDQQGPSRLQSRTGEAEQFEGQAHAISAESADAAAQDRKWEFGTAKLPEEEGDKFVYPAMDEQTHTATEEPAAQSPIENGEASTVGTQPGLTSPSNTTRRAGSHDHVDPFTVRDYGFGFGRRGGLVTVNPTVRQGEDSVKWREGDAPPTSGRSRRGSYNGVNGYDRGVRGRGRGRGYGRGYSGRGGRGQYPVSPIIPSHRGAQSPQDFEEEAMYYPAVQSPTVGYVAPGFEQYPAYPIYPPFAPPPTAYTGAPVPVPVTKVSFPLDPTRYYLLGQLEYYVGAENLAHDLFLRKKMDKRGWIHIPVLALFPRVRSLTNDQQLVKEVLILSSLVDVRGEWVRVHRWEQYVLPNAPESTVEPTAGTGEGAVESPEGQHNTSEHSGHGARDLAVPADIGADHEAHPYLSHEGYSEHGYAPAPYGYYLPPGEYPAEYAGHDGGYVPDRRERMLFNTHAQGQTLSREDTDWAEGRNSQEAHADSFTSEQHASGHQHHEELDENDEFEESESDESEVEFVLGKDANRSWTPERKQG